MTAFTTPVTRTPDIPVRIRTSRTGAPVLPLPIDPCATQPAPYDPVRGWPLAVPRTHRTAYLSGMTALNLPATSDDQHPGDWHAIGTWWSPTYLNVHDRPSTAVLWGPDGDITAAPCAPRLRDARPALARLGHPAAGHQAPVLAATVPQAVVDLAWDQLRHGRPAIDRHTVARWTGRDDEDPELCMLAQEIETMINDPVQRGHWRHWRLHHLQGPDRLELPATPPVHPKRPPMDIVIRAS